MYMHFSLKATTTLVARINIRTTIQLQRPAHPFCKVQLRSASTVKTQKPWNKKNDKIPFKVVRVLGEDGHMSEPRQLQHVLEETDLDLKFVELVRERPFPLVKIGDKEEQLLRMHAAKLAAKNSKSKSQKELHLTWGMANGDIAHRINRARELLAKGHRLSLVFQPKGGQDWKLLPAWNELIQHVDKTVEGLADVGSEWRERTVEKKTVYVFMQSSVKPVISETEAAIGGKMLQKLNKLKEKKQQRDLHRGASEDIQF
ncbi:hypothetical protein BDQ17DRAFT_1541368 [Cyathus striatus]|nr:hypothetical protein BDQ17DRAFT_1541368 [Cyathus striatus]